MQFNTDNGGPSIGCQPLPINGLDRAFIPYQDDLRTDETNDGIFTAVIGSPPNRQLVIEWRTTYFQRSGTANFEVILSEDSGTLSVIYGATGDNGARRRRAGSRLPTSAPSRSSPAETRRSSAACASTTCPVAGRRHLRHLHLLHLRLHHRQLRHLRLHHLHLHLRLLHHLRHRWCAAVC
jgi:hypothetical protein